MPPRAPSRRGTGHASSRSFELLLRSGCAQTPLGVVAAALRPLGRRIHVKTGSEPLAKPAGKRSVQTIRHPADPAHVTGEGGSWGERFGRDAIGRPTRGPDPSFTPETTTAGRPSA